MTRELFAGTLPLLDTVGRTPRGRSWLNRLPDLVTDLATRWQLRLEPPFHGGSCSWVAPARLPDGHPVVLKLSWPHREAAGEAEALRLWDGNRAVRLLREDPDQHALLLERCDPGQPLGSAHHLSAEQQLLIAAEILRELWQTPIPALSNLEQLSDVTAEWAVRAQTRGQGRQPDLDPGLVTHGIHLLRELPASAARTVLVHGDFNPANIVSSRRGWLALDPKPMIGDPAYDPWPLLELIDDPFRHANPSAVLTDRFVLLAAALETDVERLQAWGIARRVETALDVAAAGRSGAHSIMAEARALANLLGI